MEGGKTKERGIFGSRIFFCFLCAETLPWIESEHVFGCARLRVLDFFFIFFSSQILLPPNRGKKKPTCRLLH